MFLTKQNLEKIPDDVTFDIIASCDHNYMDTTVIPPVPSDTIKRGAVWCVVKKWNNTVKSFVLEEALQHDGKHWRFPLHVYDESNYGFSIGKIYC